MNDIMYTLFELKCIERNNGATIVGSPLLTLKGSVIKRDSKYNLGKKMSNMLYFHKLYAERVLKDDLDMLCIISNIKRSVKKVLNSIQDLFILFKKFAV